jgi:hypothetical protein
MRGLAFVSALLAALVPAALGCGGDHSRLAKSEGGGGSGGGGGAGSGASSSQSVGGGGTLPVEPEGPTKLTVVNGIADYDAVRLCFVPYPDGSGGTPWPGASGLAFAESAVLDPATGPIPRGSDVEVIAMTGDLDATSGMDCDALEAAPPAGVERRALAVLPATALAEPKSVVLVTTGCMGGPGHDDEELAIDACGFGYASDQPSATLVAGFLSRLPAALQVSLQFVQGAMGLQTAAVAVKPGAEPAAGILAVDEWSWGAIAPFPPFINFSLDELGSLPEAAVELSLNPASNPFEVITFGAAFANSDLDIDEVVNGSAVTFVAVGAAPSAGGGSWWQPFTLTVVENDPD